MRILFVTPQPPSPTGGGAAIRNWHLVQAAKHAGHSVSVVSQHDVPGNARYGEIYMQMIRRTMRTRRERVQQLLLGSEPDIAQRLANRAMRSTVALMLDSARQEQAPYDFVQIEGIEMWGNISALIPALVPVRIYDAHNAETVLQGRTAVNALKTRNIIGAAYSAVQWAKLRAYERDVVRSATATFALSPQDARALERLSGREVNVVPVGVDTAYFASDAPGLPPLTPFDVVFSGTLDYRPNADAARWLVREIWPLVRAIHPAARLAIVGRNPLPELRAHNGRNGVTITGAVPDDRPYMASASVYALPIRFGAGVRLKLLNAMSMGCAVITTPAGAEGVVVQNGRDLLLAPPKPMGFASGIAAMLTFPQARARYGVAARRLMVAQHDWSRVTPALLAVYDHIERGHGWQAAAGRRQ